LPAIGELQKYKFLFYCNTFTLKKRIYMDSVTSLIITIIIIGTSTNNKCSVIGSHQ